MSVLYLDASALVTLASVEASSAAMLERANDANLIVTSIVATVEVPRALARAGVADTAEGVLERCAVVALDATIARRAASLAPDTLRALDAIHVATALGLASELDAFVTYDRRQAAAAVAAGLQVELPGQAED